ncbi:MAG TPA: NnrS family protein [Candidatus Acidoferrum sp.]|nr:NnrS family protein [Candidatus Acidoferrum sp.]
MSEITRTTRISLRDAAREPFRFFFPQAVLAGILGVMLWPLHFWGVSEFYPNLAHVRVMANGFFGGFIIGFLGTAMPRMLSAKPFTLAETLILLLLHAAMTIAYAVNKTFYGDVVLLLLLVRFVICLARRFGTRKDTPPPGFVLVLLSFICVTAGAILSIAQNDRDFDSQWIALQRLLSSQGFVLLPVLGIGPFILPRFFGMPSAHDFAEMLKPSPAWAKKALFAFGVGILIIGTFFLEAFGWFRLAHALRFLVTLIYLAREFPFGAGPKSSSALGLALRIALITLLAGFLSVAFFPQFRTGLIHLTLVGGFAIITFIVATRVVFGHSGNIEKLKGKNRWLLWIIGLILFAMATRISGDIWPKVMISHYVYGAIIWAVAVIWWAIKVLPKVREHEAEE